MTRVLITRQDGTRRVVEVSRTGKVKSDLPACETCQGSGVAAAWVDAGYSPDNGYSFGDDQVLADQAHRYVWPLPDGTFIVLDHEAAVMHREDDGTRWYWDERTSVTHCRDFADPGSSEIDVSMDYGEGSALFFGSPEAARDDAARIIRADWRHAFYSPTLDNPMGEARNQRETGGAR